MADPASSGPNSDDRVAVAESVAQCDRYGDNPEPGRSGASPRQLGLLDYAVEGKVSDLSSTMFEPTDKPKPSYGEAVRFGALALMAASSGTGRSGMLEIPLERTKWEDDPFDSSFFLKTYSSRAPNARHIPAPKAKDNKTAKRRAQRKARKITSKTR